MTDISSKLKELTDLDKKGLLGELTLSQWNDNGMSLFKKGLVTLDPLMVGRKNVSEFKLTQKGVVIAKALHKEKGPVL